MGWWRVVLCSAVLALVGGCGDGETGEAEGPAAVGYMPAESLVIVAPTELDGEQLRRLERLAEPALREFGGPTSVRKLLELSIRGEGVSFERDVEPLLGGDLVLGLGPDGTVAALETPDGEGLADVLTELGYEPQREHRGAQLYELEESWVAVDDATLVVGSAEQQLEQAIDRMRDQRGFDPDAFTAALPAGDGEPFLRVAADARAQTAALPLGDAAELPWVRAVRSFGLTLALEQDAVIARGRVATDPAGLSDDDLPLAAGEEAPAVGDVDGAIAAANRDQSRTTVFLAQFARRAFPDSRFVRSVERIEADLGIGFEQEVLAQFNGPSASVATPRGAFAAVSDVADPDRMRALLPRLAPRLPEVLRGLEGLGSRGLLALLLFAPDAPLAPGLLPSLQAGIDVQALQGAGDEQLFAIRGLSEPAPAEVVFGMIGDRFVVATDLERARSVVQMPVAELDGARGAGVARTDLRTWSEGELAEALGIPTVPLGEAVGELEASTRGLEGRLRVEVPGGL